jgi:hypothetical protein
MTASFIAIAFVAAVLIVNWRLLLPVSASLLIALVVFGVGVVQPEQATVRAPGPNTSQSDLPGQSAAVVGQPGPR